MSRAKTKFIRKYGTKVEIRKWAGGVYLPSISTHALLGRGSKTNSVMDLLENQREGILPADSTLDGGNYVHNVINGENFIVTGTLPEYGVNETLSIVANMLICNNKLTAKGQRKVGDSRGNLKTEFVTICSDIPCSVQDASSELKSVDAGLMPETEYVIYAPYFLVMETDKIEIIVNGKALSLKVVYPDYVTFDNMVVIQVCRDIRE